MFWFFHILGMSRSQLTFTPSFFRGVARVGIPPTSIYIFLYIHIKYIYIYIIWWNTTRIFSWHRASKYPMFDSAWVYPRPRWQRRASRPPWCPPTPDGLTRRKSTKNPAVVMVSWWKSTMKGFMDVGWSFFLEFDDFDGSLLPKKSRIDCFLTRKVGKPTWRRSCFDMKGGILTRKMISWRVCSWQATGSR